METSKKHAQRYAYEDALELTGFGRYNLSMLLSCCLLILAMFVDIFGFAVMLPPVACDFQLSISQQGLLSAVPLIGTMVSSYAWGLCADTMGRRRILLIAMPVGLVFNLAASLAPNFATLAALKFLSASFTSSANAAGFVLLGESVPRNQRSWCMLIMASATMSNQLVISLMALPIFSMSFRHSIPCLALEYRPWRLLMAAVSIPGVLGILAILFLHESPKFLLSRKKEEDALKVLKLIYACNNRKGIDISFQITSVYLEEMEQVSTEPLKQRESLLGKMWNQTAPLFKPPLLRNNLILYYMLLCAYMTATGFTMWVPTITNAYFSGDDVTGKTFCEVASTVARTGTTQTNADCNNIVPTLTLYSTMAYSGLATALCILLSFLIKPMGKKRSTLLVFALSTSFGLMLFFVKIPILSILLFFLFLYVAFILGNTNTYLVELNPTHLRGMATCLSVVVARGFGFISVQLIAELLTDHCQPMLAGYLLLVASGFVASCFLPSDTKKDTKHVSSEQNS